MLWRDACAARGWNPQDSDRRHAIYEQIFGAPKNFAAFTNRDFDRVKAHFLSLADPADLHAQMRAQDQPRARLQWKIRQSAPEAYWKKICRGKFHTQDLEDLDESQLTMMRNTIAARMNRLRNRVAEQPERGASDRVSEETELVDADGVSADNKPF